MIVAELAAKLGLAPDEHSWEHGHELVESLHHALEAYIGVEAVKKTGELVESFVETGVQAKHLGERLGISTEAVQELGYAASLSGSSAEGMQVSLQHLARGIQELKTKGSGPAAEAFQRLGISMNQIKGESLDQNLEVIANKFAAMPDSAEKTALAMQLFGRSGTELIPLLNRGQAGIVELREEAEKLGFVIGDEGVEKAEEFERAQKKLHASITGLKNQAVEALLPTLERLVDRMTDWIAENKEAITSTLESVVDGLATAFTTLGDVIGEVIDFWQEHQEVAIAVLEAVGAVLAAFAIDAAADWIIAFAPLAAIIAGIAALILIVEDFGAIWDKVKDVVGGAWDWIKGKGQDFADWFAALPDDVADWVDSIGERIKQAFQDAWDYITDGAKQAWEDIKDIPVIGHIIRGAEAVGEYFGTSGNTLSNSAPVGVLPSGGGGGDVTNHVSFGDVHVQVDATNVDEDEIGDLVGEKVKEHQGDMVRQAWNSLTGGKR